MLIQWRGREKVYGDGESTARGFINVGENSGSTWVALSERYRARGIVTEFGLIPSMIAPHHQASIMRHIEFRCTGVNHQSSYLLRFPDNRCSWLSRSLRLFEYITVARYDDSDDRSGWSNASGIRKIWNGLKSIIISVFID